MRLSSIWLSIAGVVLGFVIGFLLASSINRSEMNQLRADLENARTASRSTADEPGGETLSEDEVRQKIAEADQNPGNVSFQKNLGLALYRYGSIKNDTQIISEAKRLLERAEKLSPDDTEIKVGLGNAWFDIGYAKKDHDAFREARTWYESALLKSPQDANVRTDLGLTYFLDTPPNDIKAIEEFRRALSSDPKNERALQFIVQALLRSGDKSSASKYLAQLREVDPSNDTIESLASEINSNSNGAVK